MARKPRLFVAGMPYHVIQRGNNRNPIFFSETDYIFFLDVLREAKEKHPCHIHSYCLMSNHFHLLLVPLEADNISLFMKFTGAKYVRYVNKFHARSGSLWEGRFKCSLIQEDSYFSTCTRYIEMNPVRAGMVIAPEEYRWASFRSKVTGEANPLLDTDPWYEHLDQRKEERRKKYREFFQRAIPENEWELIRMCTNRGDIMGSQDFKQEMGKLTGRDLTLKPQGRPPQQTRLN